MTVRYAALPTEQSNPRSRGLDRMTPLAVLRLMHREDRRAVRAVGGALRAIARAARAAHGALSRGGNLVFVGAGTSGRLGVLEAAECPPTFGTPPARVRAIVAGGPRAVFRAREGAEDDAGAGARAIARSVRRADCVVGVSASGVTPFVRGALAAAKRRGAATVLVTCRPARPLARAAGIVIGIDTGPEVVTGSTRLKAGTATKLVLNMLTTAAMVRWGRVEGNAMVELAPGSRKLRARAARVVAALAGISETQAQRLLARSGGRARAAVARARGRPARSRS